MNTDILWDIDESVVDFGIDVPLWINQDITVCDIAAINQGGCASGAYMPAVTYYTANKTMAEYGDEILGYIENHTGELPDVTGESWQGMAVNFLSCAVELWASSIEYELIEAIESESVEDGEW